jgi:carbon monoxide dehydrogenase subunit G
MASARAHARIDRPADEVWKIVGDPDSIAVWMPGIDSSSTDASGLRTVVVTGGLEVQEQVGLRDDALRRMQYSIVSGPLPFDEHRATIDVLEDGDGAILVYAVDVRPDELVSVFSQMTTGAVHALVRHFS